MESNCIINFIREFTFRHSIINCFQNKPANTFAELELKAILSRIPPFTAREYVSMKWMICQIFVVKQRHDNFQEQKKIEPLDIAEIFRINA